MARLTCTLGVLVLAATALVGCGSDSSSSGAGMTELEPDADVNGTTTVELAELMTGAWVESPAESNSAIDPTLCDMGLSTDDYYLAPSWVEPGTAAASCTMKADQALVLFTAGLMCVDVAGDNGASPECLEDNWGLTSASVTIDGEVFDDWEDRVVSTDAFPVSLVEGNIFEAEPEDTEMRARQTIFVFDGLAVGEHDIVIAGNFDDGDFAGQLDLTLTVEA